MKHTKDLKLKDNAKIEELTEAALKKEMVESQKKMFGLNMKKAAGELKQTHLLKFIRRYIARLRTFATKKGYTID